MSNLSQLKSKNSQTEDGPFSKSRDSQISKISKRQKKLNEAKNEDSQQHYIWSINKVLDEIFKYTDFKDLVKFNTVCKKWNNSANPIIHRNIKLLRSGIMQYKVHDKMLKKAARTEAEASECIVANTKFASYVKEFTFSQAVESQRVIEFFETFKYIEYLTIRGLNMAEDQLINVIKPLSNLKELKLDNVDIKGINKKRYNTQPVQLPSTLNKLSISHVNTRNDPEIFLQTINSHTNLTEFKIIMDVEHRFLEPFCIIYPSLKRFEYCRQSIVSDIHVSVFSIIESNPQIRALKFELKCFDNKIASYVNKYLVDLEEFNLIEHYNIINGYLVNSPFSQPTKIKKISLTWDNLCSYSLESMIMSCPDLEELIITKSDRQYGDSKLFINLSNPTKIKKLVIQYDDLAESSLDSIVTSCPHLKELDIRLPRAWKEWIKIIGTKCTNLEKLSLCPNSYVFVHENQTYIDELYSSEYFNNSCYKDTLTHLTLNNYNFYNSKNEHFEKFSNLKKIKFLWQVKPNSQKNKQLTKKDNNLWPAFDLIEHDFHERYFNIELFKL